VFFFQVKICENDKQVISVPDKLGCVVSVTQR